MRAFVVLLLLLAASGCAPKEGRHCSASTLATCADKSSALVCVDSSYSRAICGGPQGCTPRRDGVSCDDTAARPGAICATDGAVACSADGTAELVCAAHRFVVASTCHGPDGCAVAADHRLTCDSTRAEAGDPCDQENRYACAVDLKAQLRCKDRRYVLVNTCMGPGRCQAKTEETSFDCDDDLATAGDPCEDEDDLACSLDHKLRLRCVKAQFTDDATCHGPGLCTMRVEGGVKHFAITCP